MSWIVGTAYAMGAQPAGAGGGDAFTQIMPFILIFVVFYFLLIRPQQKKAKEHSAMLAALKKGDAVITAGGMFGRIVEVDGDVMVVDIGETRVKIGRAYLNLAPGSKSAAPAPRKESKKSKKGDAPAEAVREAPKAEEAPAAADADKDKPAE